MKQNYDKTLKRTVCFCLLLFCSFGSGFAQIRTISGKVSSSDGGVIPGVNIIQKGASNGVVTDFDGNYQIELKEGASVLVFSFIGFQTVEEPIGNRDVINIILKEDTQALDEVVVVGYGTQKKESLTGAISDVKSKDLTVAPIASTANALAGRLPGLISQQNSGLPGADAAKLSIRGFGDALVIVDGIEADFNSIDANQIESISILKDGSASIYGARAGNGVILITTKRGSSGKPTITFNSSYTLQGITSMPKTVSAGQYAEMAREKWIQSGQPEETAPFTLEQIQKFYEGSDPQYPNTDWYDVLIRDWAPQLQNNLSVRGGSEKVKYYGFLGYMNQETIWKKSGGNYTRYNLQSNLDAKISDNLSLRIDIASTIEARRYPMRPMGDSGSGVWQDFWNTLPIYPSSLPDSTKIPFAFGAGTGGAHVTTNRKISGYNDSDSQNLKGTISLNYSFKGIEGLSARGFINYSQDYSTNKAFFKPVDFYTYDTTSDIYTLAGSLGSKAQLDIQKYESRMITSQFSLNYDNMFGSNKEHHVTALMLYESIDYSSNWISAGRKNFLTDTIDQLFAGSTDGMSNNGSANEMGRVSYVGRLNYTFKEKYLLESIIRADASAKFPKNSRWGYFPSISLGWRISEEKFFKDSKVLSNLKLRASYGEAGNDNIGNFQYLSGYQFNYYTYILGNGPQQGLVSKGLPNPYLTWEKIKTYNIGLDFSLFDKKIYGEGDVFYRKRAGMLANRLATLPSTFGATLPPENINSSNDRGFELKLGTKGNTENWMWDISGNISWSRAKWDHYEEPDYTDPDQKRLYALSGQWMDKTVGFLSDGLFTSQEEIDNLTFDQDQQGNVTLRPGDIRYVDLDQNGILDWRDQSIGKGTVPHWMLGFNTNLQYKHFDFSALFQGAFGYYHYLSLNPANGQMYPTFVYKERWTESNNDSNALIPRLGGAGTNNLVSDFRYKKAGYVRLKTLSIGYSIPKKILRNNGLESIRIFVSGTNLLTFDRLSKYDVDPEAPSGNGGSYYPQQRTISLGTNISF